MVDLERIIQWVICKLISSKLEKKLKRNLKLSDAYVEMYQVIDEKKIGYLKNI